MEKTSYIIKTTKVWHKCILEYSYSVDAIKTIDHLYLKSPITRALWDKLLKWIGIHMQIGSWQQKLIWAKGIGIKE